MRFPVIGWKSVALTAVGVTSAWVSYDVYRRRHSVGHSLGTQLKHYLVINFMKHLGKNIYTGLEKQTENFMEEQERFLLEFLQTNKDTVYGRDHDFAAITSCQDFRERHPLTRYPDYESYIERLKQGEEKVLTEAKPTILGITSGTSGKCCLLPSVPKLFTIFFKGIAVLYHVMVQNFPDIMNLQKDLKIFYTPQTRPALGGIPVGPNSSNPKNSKSVWCMYSTPPPAFDILTEQEALYVHLLFGLKDRNLGMLEANFISLIYNSFQTLQKIWRQLCLDIESGVIDSDLKIDPEIRKQLQKYMTPDFERSAELRREFQKGFEGIAKRIWPHMYMVLSVDTGTFELYGKLLQQCELKGIPVFSPLYAASEGLIGLNIKPTAAGREYLLIPSAMFFEFIPVEHSHEEQPVTFFGNKVEVGEMYELVLTTCSGLCRYRFGDVVKVSSFHNQTPNVEFMYRQGQLLNVRGEKTTEHTFFQVVSDVSTRWQQETGASMVDYCCAENVLTRDGDGSAPSYVLFVELSGGEDEKLTTKQMEMVDASLCLQNDVYESFRKKGSIGGATVHVVRPGSFRELRSFMLENTEASSNQYKVPRVLRRPEAVEFMMNKVLY